MRGRRPDPAMRRALAGALVGLLGLALLSTSATGLLGQCVLLPARGLDLQPRDARPLAAGSPGSAGQRAPEVIRVGIGPHPATASWVGPSGPSSSVRALGRGHAPAGGDHRSFQGIREIRLLDLHRRERRSANRERRHLGLVRDGDHRSIVDEGGGQCVEPHRDDEIDAREPVEQPVPVQRRIDDRDRRPAGQAFQANDRAGSMSRG